MRDPHEPVAELWDALERDPRRLVVLVGDASRLALELARHAPAALYPNPLTPTTELPTFAVTHGRPVVVLDGPLFDEALAPIERLVSHHVHDRLLVIVPVDEANAARVLLLAGGYPKRSTLVCSVDAGAAQVDVPDALFPFALLGRAPSGHFPEEEALRRAGLISSPVDGQVVCLAGEAARRTLIERASDDRIVAAAVDRGRALTSVLALRGEVIEGLAPRNPGELVDPWALTERGIAVSPVAVDRIVAWAAAMLPTAGDDTSRVLELLARDDARRGEHERAVARLREAEQRSLDRVQQTRLRVALGVATGDETWFRAATETAPRRADVLRRWARTLDLHDRTDDALARLEAATDDTPAGAAATNMLAAAIARASEAPDRAIELAQRAARDRISIGDVRGALRSKQLVLSLLIEGDRRDEARTLAEECVALAETIGDGVTIGYARWVLGALADIDADPRAAAAHYQAAIAGYNADGAPVPERLLEAIRPRAHDDADPTPERDRVRLSVIPTR